MKTRTGLKCKKLTAEPTRHRGRGLRDKGKHYDRKSKRDTKDSHEGQGGQESRGRRDGKVAQANKGTDGRLENCGRGKFSRRKGKRGSKCSCKRKDGWVSCGPHEEMDAKDK